MTAIPASTIYSSERGDRGLVVWAIQRGLNSTGYLLAEDSDYGPVTEGVVRDFQEKHGLAADGVFGPASSAKLAWVLERAVRHTVPAGLLRGLVEGESGELIGAVSWSSPGGVDCSYVQRRVYESQFGTDAEYRAFDALYQLNLLARRLRERKDAFYGRENVVSHERAWRLATLHHNYPYAADKLSHGEWKTSYSTSPQDWVIRIGARFDDGTPVETPLQWCKWYSLGAQRHDHPGTMVRYVRDWIP